MTTTMTTLTTMRGEEAIASITIMTTITTMQVSGGCEGTAHLGLDTTYEVVVIVPNANMWSSLTTTLTLAMTVMIAMSVMVQGDRIIKAVSSCLVIIAAVRILVVSLLPMPRGMTVMSIIAQKQWWWRWRWMWWWWWHGW